MHHSARTRAVGQNTLSISRPSSRTSLLTPTTDIHYRTFNKKSRLFNCSHIKAIHSSYDNCQVTIPAFVLLILESSGEWASSEQTKQREKVVGLGFKVPRRKAREARRKVNLQGKGVPSFKKETQTQTRCAFGNLTQRKLSGPFLQSCFPFFFFFSLQLKGHSSPYMSLTKTILAKVTYHTDSGGRQEANGLC